MFLSGYIVVSTLVEIVNMYETEALLMTPGSGYDRGSKVTGRNDLTNTKRAKSGCDREAFC